jgi:hypothetical protein
VQHAWSALSLWGSHPDLSQWWHTHITRTHVFAPEAWSSHTQYCSLNVCDPRLRCYALHMPQVCDTRVLFSGRPDLLEQMKGRPLASWMWGGLSLPEALGQFMTAGGC